MDARTTKSLVDDVFLELENATSVEGIHRIIESKEILKKNAMPAHKYPSIAFNLDGSDILQLKQSGMLDVNNCLIPDLSSRELTPLEKLLYSVLWKNGDLQKEKHIIEGVSDKYSDIEPRKGLVFFQFGRSLRYQDEPIIDQHVLRAFAIRNFRLEDSDAIKDWRSLSIVSNKHVKLINDYRKWILSDSITTSLRSAINYAQHIDRLLFALGKSVKEKKNR